MATLAEFRELKKEALQIALKNIRGFNETSDIFRGFKLEPEERAAVSGDNQAHRVLEQRGEGVLEGVVAKLIDFLLPDEMAEKIQPAEGRPKAVIIAGALGCNVQLFNMLREGRSPHPSLDWIAKDKGSFYFKAFDAFYIELYKMLKDLGFNHLDIENPGKTFPGVRAFSGVIEAARVVIERLNGNWVGADNFDAHPDKNSDTAKTALANIEGYKNYGDFYYVGYALTPLQAWGCYSAVVDFKDGKPRFDPSQVGVSATGVATFYARSRFALPNVLLLNAEHKVIFHKKDDEVLEMTPEFASWMKESDVELKDVYLKNDRPFNRAPETSIKVRF